MGGEVNRRAVLAQRPRGVPVASDFRIEDEPLAPLDAGGVRVDVSHLSIDPFIRTSLEEVSYHPSLPIGHGPRSRAARNKLPPSVRHALARRVTPWPSDPECAASQ